MPDSPLQTPPSSMHKIFDMILKISGASLLAWLTFLLNYSNTLSENGNKLKQQEIDNSMKYGQFAQSMMQALVSKDSTGNNIARDMAFTVLNSTVVGGGKDSAGQKMIADVGYCIISDYYSNRKNRDTTSNMKIILNIIRQRDMQTFKKCEEVMREYNGNKATISDSLAIVLARKMNANDTNMSISANLSSNHLDRITLLTDSATVFMQINNSDRRDSAGIILGSLKAKGYNTPPEQLIHFKYRSVIKCFFDADTPAAKNVQLVLHKMNIDVPVKQYSNERARPGIIELWYNFQVPDMSHKK